MGRCQVIAGALLALLAAGCSGQDGGARDEAASPTSTTAALSALQPGDRYVALGSSIASGFGISVQSTSCGRSDRSYPNLVAQHFELELIDVSCGAATIANVVDAPQGENPVQLAALTPDTALVTVSVGGNDIAYNATAFGCGNPATECTARPTLDADVAALRRALPAMLDQIRSVAPSAAIVFVTYPRETPAEGSCPALSFTDTELDVVRSMGESLQQAFLDVVEPLDLVFVDPYSEPGDHTGCAAADQRWTAGYAVEDGFAYHPTALGHQVMADMVVDALDN